MMPEKPVQIIHYKWVIARVPKIRLQKRGVHTAICQMPFIYALYLHF